MIVGGEHPEQLSALFEVKIWDAVSCPTTNNAKPQALDREHGQSQGPVSSGRRRGGALTQRGKRLLPSGIIAVRGTFEAGDSVACVDHAEREIAKGLVNLLLATITRSWGKEHSIQKTLDTRITTKLFIVIIRSVIS